MRNSFVRYDKMTESAEIPIPEVMPPIHICVKLYDFFVNNLYSHYYYSDWKDVEGTGKWNVGGGIFDKDAGVVAA